MIEELVNLLIEKEYSITTAESCTGGMIASSIVDIANASKVFNQAFVTYANEAKIKYLKVNEDTIKEHGVVSEEVCFQMAKGAQREANANVALVTSGIAGPTGGTPTKPVGMVCFGIAINDNIYTYTKYFGNVGRNKVRTLAKDFIIAETVRLLK